MRTSSLRPHSNGNYPKMALQFQIGGIGRKHWNKCWHHPTWEYTSAIIIRAGHPRILTSKWWQITPSRWYPPTKSRFIKTQRGLREPGKDQSLLFRVNLLRRLRRWFRPLGQKYSRRRSRLGAVGVLSFVNWFSGMGSNKKDIKKPMNDEIEFPVIFFFLYRIQMAERFGTQSHGFEEWPAICHSMKAANWVMLWAWLYSKLGAQSRSFLRRVVSWRE